MAKQRIRLTEGQLHNIIRRAIMESSNPLDELYDAITYVLRLSEDLHRKLDYETLRHLRPRMDELDNLLKKAARLADPNYAVKYESK